MNEQSTPSQKLERHIGWGIFVGVFIFYAALAPAFAVPGRWSAILTSFSGLDPFRPLVRPLWSILVALLAALPVPNLAVMMNLVTAALGAAVCWTLYASVRLVPFERSFRRKTKASTERLPRLVAGIFSAIFAAVSLPMIMVATRGDFAVLDALLMVLTFYPALIFWQKPRLALFYISCTIFGLALVEYPTMVFVLPAFFIWWLLLLWKAKMVKPMTMLTALAMMAAGVLVLLLCTALYASTAFAAIRDLTNASSILKGFLQLYKGELMQSVPKVGWLLIFGMNVLPFAVVMLSELNEPADRFSAIGVYTFRLVLLMLAVFTLFALPGSPARVLGPKVLLVAPSLLVAIWFGYLMGYYAGLLTQRKRHVIRAVFLGGGAIMLAYAGIRHAKEVDVRHLRPVNDFAEQVIQNLNGRTYVITDGSLDSSLMLAARKLGVRVSFINATAPSSAEFGRYYAGMFHDPDLQGLASISAKALLSGWLGRDADATKKMAILTSPDAFYARDAVLIPDGVFYSFHHPESLPEAEAFFVRQESVWSGIALPNLAGRTFGDTGWFQGQFLVRWISRLANDTGVFLEERNRSEFASEAFRKALDVWPDNVSAALNLREVVRRDFPDDLEALDARLKTQLERNPSALNVHYLAKNCGLVRNATAILEQAAALHKRGLTEQAVDKMNIATAMTDDEDARGLLALAQAQARANNVGQSEAIYHRILETRPDNLDAYYGLMQVAMNKRDLTEAERLLQIMEDKGADPVRLKAEKAMLVFMSGKLDEARRLYMELAQQDGAPSEVWFSLANIALQQKDEALLDQAFAALEKDRSYLPGQLLLGERALLRKRTAEAQAYFTRVLTLDPYSEAALVRLIQIDFQNRDASALRLHTGKLLAINPDHEFGNFMSSYVHIAAGNLELAEAALQRSLRQRDDAAARNELAWVLNELKKPEEALIHAKRALELTPNHPNYLDTYAGILYKLGRMDEALAIQEQALEITNHQEPTLLLHVAKMYRDTKRESDYQRVMEQLRIIADLLPTDQKKDLTEQIRRLER